jgi:hypothetical protein
MKFSILPELELTDLMVTLKKYNGVVMWLVGGWGWCSKTFVNIGK